MPVDDAKAWLTQIKGIGPKTAAIILLFSLGMPDFPVDTHVHRVTRRLGLVPEAADAVKTFRMMAPLVPDGKSYSLHMNLIRLGRTVCTARSPKCLHCPLYAHCRWPERPERE